MHKLLILLRDSHIKEPYHQGLCYTASQLYWTGKIKYKEFERLRLYLLDNKPKHRPVTCNKKDWLDNYYWTRRYKPPRLRWLNKHIKLTKPS